MKRWYCILILFSFLFTLCTANVPDSLSKGIISWQLNEDFYTTKRIHMDTTIEKFHIYKLLYINCVSNTFLGNLGTPYEKNIFFQRDNFSDFVFFNNYLAYLHVPEYLHYYKTKTPFTHIMYTTSLSNKEQSEETINVLHTQNINQNLNAGFSYDRISSKGLYVRQKAIATKFTLFSSYTQKKYFFHFNAGLNTAKHDENGGIMEIDSFMNKTDDPSRYAMRLNNANTVLKNKSIFLAHGYVFDLIKSRKEVDSVIVSETRLQGTLLHTFRFDHNFKTFADQLGFYTSDPPDTAQDWYYYDTLNLINRFQTLDSVYFRSINNYIQYEFEPGKNSWLKSGLRVGIGNEIVKYSMSTLDTSGFIEGYADKTVNSYLSSELYNSSGLNWKWKVYARYYFMGYKNSDIVLQGLLGKHIKFGKDSADISIEWINKSSRPNYFYLHYYSNNVRWNNDNFLNINETIFKGSVDIRSRKLALGVNYSLIDNYIYQEHHDSVFPYQYGKPLNILALSVENTFTFWKLTTVNKIFYQVVNNSDILSLPKLIVFNSTYFRQTIIENVLDAQLGFDIYYNTSYYADAFHASYGMFYNQKEMRIGNYPFIDVHISAKLKRTRFFIKYNHVNSGLLGRKYFTTYRYPMNYRNLKFGISWMFYD